MSRVLSVIALVAGSVVAACDAMPDAGDTASMRLGGVIVSGRVLARGEAVYRQRCMVCHGDRGDGQGPSGRHLKPPPRDLRKGEYKFAPAPDALPDDAYFHRILSEGIPNTMMQPWGLDHDDRHAVIQYVKSLSPRWREPPP